MIPKGQVKIYGEEAVRSAIDGFFSLTPNNESNPFSKLYVKHWDQFVEEMVNYDISDTAHSFYIIMSAAKEYQENKYKRCGHELQQIENFAQNFIDNYESYYEKTPEVQNPLVKSNLKMWKKMAKSFDYQLCIAHTKLLQEIGHFFNVQIPDPEYKKSFDEYLDQSIEFLGHRLVDLGKSYARFRGIDNAIQHFENNESIDYYENIEGMYSRSNDYGFAKNDPPAKTIRELMLASFTIDPASKLRFLHLTQKENYSHRDAYEKIFEELKEMDIEPWEHIPETPKDLSNRARRYRKKWFNELSLLSGN